VKLVSSPVSREMSRLCARPIRLFSRAPNISLTRKFTCETVSTDSRASLGFFLYLKPAGDLFLKNTCLLHQTSACALSRLNCL